ncbi:hypothetical protein PHLCEN_2v1621 [Hermanssonia centrifuga]|uniref:Uncharacterized protein n=1 Tax=Hermanssonia centrifuga TaxID=98765 RepID=A0A2R6RZM8_9APHY|nr:hypothetical protein PHLCEN_2v1621 [Hermanssonia centrifuga]
MRRAPSLPLHPPPPYAPRMDMILDSPISVTAQLVSSRSTTPADGDAAASEDVDADFAMEEWRNEKSREELSDLLVVAGDIIKSRGTGQSTSRLPGQRPSPLPSPNRPLSPLTPASPHYYSGSLPHTPTPTSPRIRHSRRISVTPGEIALLADQNAELLDKLEKLEEESAHADLAGKRKLRKLEREIQGLREELEKTQAKGVELEEKAKEVLAMSEDEVMKRKREEREEKMRALRESLKVASSDPSPSTIATLSLGEEVRDFAPGRELSRSTASSSSTKTSPSPISHALPLPTKVLSAPGTITSIPEEPGPSSTSYFPRLSDTQPQLQSQPPPLEYAIISQLLSKIRELEETNAEISQEQKATAERLQAAQWDAESIRRAYDCLSDEAGGVHVIEDDDDDFADASDSFNDSVEYEPPVHLGKSSPGNTGKRIASGSTIRFSSLRRTIDGNISKLSLCEDLKDDFDLGISKDMQSTTRSVYSLHPKQQSAASGKPRKSVMGLFDVDGDAEANAQGPYPKTLSVSPAFRAAVRGMGADLADMSTWSIAATDGFERTSPSPSPSLSPFPSPLRLSSLSPPTSRSPSPSPSSSPLNLPIAPSPLFHSHMPSSLSFTSFFGSQRKPHTLGSELGSEFGDGEEEGGWNHHLRASSLYDLSGMVSGAGSVSGSSVPPSPGIEKVGIPGGWDEREADPGVEGDDDERREGPGDGVVEAGSATTSSVGGSATPTRSVLSGRGNQGGGLQLQFVVEPPTPSLGKSLRTTRSSHSLRSARSLGVGSSKTIGGGGRSGEAQERESRASRSARLSQTMKARTNRWVERVERRYAGEPEDEVFSSARSSTAAGVLRTRRSVLNMGARGHPRKPRTPSALDETFDEVVHQFSRSVSATSLDFDFSTLERDEEEAEHELPRLPHHPARFGGARLETSPSAQVMYPTKREGFVGFVLEVWLWLQFGLVVMVFLWAMARRGPKSVLEDAERRKAAAGVVRR